MPLFERITDIQKSRIWTAENQRAMYANPLQWPQILCLVRSVSKTNCETNVL